MLAIFTSTGDTATGKWFPRGRFLSARKDKTRSALQRQANRAAVGHFEPFRSHSLTPIGAPRKLAEVDDSTMESCGCPYGSGSQLSVGDPQAMQAALDQLRQVRRSGVREMEFGDVVLRRDAGPEHSPIIVASVDDSIIKGHNDIYRPAFIDFLRLFIVLAAEKTGPAADDAG